MTAPWAEGTVHRLTEVEAFDAMVAFVEAFWKRSGEPDDELGYFVRMVERLENGTFDPAHWDDWLQAIDGVLGGRRDASSIIGGPPHRRE